tara:strand:- start:250 stop:1314 length:1065 start_codon:yes stop_codon:yes gene_type:complete
MSMSRFIREVAENGIRTARSMFGSLDKKATQAQKERIEAAKKKFKDRPKTRRKSEPEGMAQDPKAGSNVRGGVDVDKGKAGRVTRSQDPGFLQQQRTPGSRARAERKAEASQKKRTGKTKAERERAARLEDAMEAKDVRDTMSAKAKGASTRTKKGSRRDQAAALPETKSLGKAEKTSTRKPKVNTDGTIVNEKAYDSLTENQKRALVRDAVSRGLSPRSREYIALMDELEPTKAGETGVRRRKGGPKGMQGATERNVKDIDEGVGGRGGLDFNKGGDAKKKKKVPVISIGIGMATVKGKKPRTGSNDFRNGGMVMSSTDNLKPVPKGNKGLGKLPKPVRNRMGFMNKGGMVKK